MVTLFRKKGFQWLILVVGILIILGLADRTAFEAESKADTKLATLQKGLVLYYSFDADQGRKVTDLSGKGNHGKVRSGTYTSNGKINRAMFFNGEGDYIDIGDDPNIQTEIFTFTAWIKTIDLSRVWQTILSFESQSYAVSVLPNGHVHYGWQRVKKGAEGKSDVRTGKWVFVAVTRDYDDRACIYVNGEIENSFACDIYSKFLYSGKIGGDVGDSEYFNGSIDEVRIHNRALSISEVKQLYNATLMMSDSKRIKSPDITIEDIRIDPDPNEGQIKVNGIVRDEQNKPVSDVLITFLPMGGKEYVTNSKGEFAGVYHLKHAPKSNLYRHRPNIYVFARHTELNLAAALQIPIGKDYKLEITLIDAVTLAGQITDPDGNPIPDAKIAVILCDDFWGAYIDPWGRWGKDNITIDHEGIFRIQTVPHGCFYEIICRAEGYGLETVEVGTWDTHKKQINLGEIVLPQTNLSVSGMVVDEKGASVPHANIEVEGDRQIRRRPIKADEEGKFTIEKLCEGTVTIKAFIEDMSLWGQKDIRAGEKDIRVLVGKTIIACKVRPQPNSLIGRKLPGFKDLNLNINTEEIRDKMLLICFWDMNHQASRHCIRKLAQRIGELRKKNIAVFAVHSAKVREKSVADFAKKIDILFPMGTIEGEVDKVHFSWGVDLLPWVILTDQDHVVTNEGFGLQILRELSE